MLVMMSSLTLPFKALQLGKGNDSTNRGKLGRVTTALNARGCTHLHFNVKGSFPGKKRVSFILKRFSRRSVGRVPRHLRMTRRVVGDFYLTKLGVAVGRCGGGWRPYQGRRLAGKYKLRMSSERRPLLPGPTGGRRSQSAILE